MVSGPRRCFCIIQKSFRSDVQSLRKPTAFPLRCGNSFTDGSRTFIEFSSPSPPMSSPYCTFGTEDADLRSSNESCRRVHGPLDVRGSPYFQQDRILNTTGLIAERRPRLPRAIGIERPRPAPRALPIQQSRAYLPTWIVFPGAVPRPPRPVTPAETSLTQSEPSPL